MFLLICVLPAFVILVIVLRSAGRYMARKSLIDNLRLLSRAVGGTLGGAGNSGYPELAFTRRGRRWKLDFLFRYESQYPHARVVVDLAGRSPGILHILPEGGGQLFLKAFGAQDLEVGDATFDAHYVVRAIPTSLVAKVFALHRREQVVESIRRIAHLSEPTIDLDRHALTIQARQLVTDLGGLNGMIQTADDFLSFLFESPEDPSPSPAGIEVGELGISAAGECPVCGTAMDRQEVRCELCRTPHHSECWRYMGRCSTYACRGIRSVA